MRCVRRSLVENRNFSATWQLLQRKGQAKQRFESKGPQLDLGHDMATQNPDQILETWEEVCLLDMRGFCSPARLHASNSLSPFHNSTCREESLWRPRAHGPTGPPPMSHDQQNSETLAYATAYSRHNMSLAKCLRAAQSRPCQSMPTRR